MTLIYNIKSLTSWQGFPEKYFILSESITNVYLLSAA